MYNNDRLEEYKKINGLDRNITLQTECPALAYIDTLND